MSFPVEEKFIDKAESELGIRFPDSFRVKMMDLNGGEVTVDRDCFTLLPFFDTSDKKRLKRTCNGIVQETRKARSHYDLPDNLVIIGDNGGGDSLVYRVAYDGSSVESTVYWLDHETGDLNIAATDFAELSTPL